MDYYYITNMDRINDYMLKVDIEIISEPETITIEYDRVSYTAPSRVSRTIYIEADYRTCTIDDFEYNAYDNGKLKLVITEHCSDCIKTKEVFIYDAAKTLSTILDRKYGILYDTVNYPTDFYPNFISDHTATAIINSDIFSNISILERRNDMIVDTSLKQESDYKVFKTDTIYFITKSIDWGTDNA